MTDWNEYILEQQKQQREAAQQIQEIIQASGMSITTIQELAKLDDGLLEPEVAQALRLRLGHVQTEPTAKKADASSWRQRTYAIRV